MISVCLHSFPMSITSIQMITRMFYFINCNASREGSSGGSRGGSQGAMEPPIHSGAGIVVGGVWTRVYRSARSRDPDVLHFERVTAFACG